MEPRTASIVPPHVVVVMLPPHEEPALDAPVWGTVIRGADVVSADLVGKTVFLCGDMQHAASLDLGSAAQRFVVAERSEHVDAVPWPVVGLGRVPIDVHGVGVYYRQFFDPSVDYFGRIQAEHEFQSLTESTKPGVAHRTGIYLCAVQPRADERYFHLLRCSTNLSGPTDNFRATDQQIVRALNQQAARLFDDAAPLNHVLAQTYHNRPATETRKQTKATIKSHADKTKDMPANGIMAFCTFYDGLDRLDPMAGDPFDRGYKKASGLTRLVFRLKPGLDEEAALPARFAITLYPHSVFFMPLSTNRWYTHEIQSSTLDAAQLPTRLGYVVRCSATEAVHRHGQTRLRGADGSFQALEPPSAEGVAELRQRYAQENRTAEHVSYGDRFRFSLNRGDYESPTYHMADEFPQYAVGDHEAWFEALAESVRWQDVSKGRQGAVLVLPHEYRGTPIVRTTTRYVIPAQRFRSVHQRLADRITAVAALPWGLNNALIERYRSTYTKMGFHSDQALDLLPNSFVAVFSCYRDPAAARRVLVIESKESPGQTFEIPMLHNHVVVFSLQTNQRFRHKIVLDRSADVPQDNEWIGVTYRTSKTFVRVVEGQATFEDGSALQLATEDEAPSFFQLRRRENQETDFSYPPISFTVSASDLMLPDSVHLDRSSP